MVHGDLVASRKWPSSGMVFTTNITLIGSCWRGEPDGETPKQRRKQLNQKKSVGEEAEEEEENDDDDDDDDIIAIFGSTSSSFGQFCACH